jgi:anion-transporting  ArsA/GET3 family ATPase
MVRLAMQSSFFNKRFVIVAGKGGVGKSTACAALGLAAARRGLRTIIAELDTREKVPLLFGKEPTGYEIQEVFENLYSINIQPDPALREYGLMKLRFERLYNIVFENEAMKKLLKVIPGMKELFLLGKAFNLERERDASGRHKWDMIIVDAPATGHGVSLLRLPQVILEVIKTGPMAEEVQHMKSLLEDSERTVINLVTLAEEMPVRETLDLQHQIESILHIPKGFLLINQVWPTALSESDRDVLTQLAKDVPDDRRVQDALACLSLFTQRRQLQERYLEELDQKVNMPSIQLPFLFEERFGFEQIDRLSRQISAQAEESVPQPKQPDTETAQGTQP